MATALGDLSPAVAHLRVRSLNRALPAPHARKDMEVFYSAFWTMPTQMPRFSGAGFRIDATSASKIEISGGRRARAATPRTNSPDAGTWK